MENTKTTLITEIWDFYKHTHNEQDLKDLQEFIENNTTLSVEELREILNGPNEI